MFYKLAAFVSFLWRSTNQHGVHSPFVYQLVTKAFYNQKKVYASLDTHIVNFTKQLPLTAKKKRLIARVCQHLNATKMTLVDANFNTQSTTTADVFFIPKNCPTATRKDFYTNINTLTHNDTVLIIECNTIFEQFKNHPQATVTIDTFAFGFVFFRREQQREHFTIRL